MRHLGFWPALISKGLRLLDVIAIGTDEWFLACPDFKGIKTVKRIVDGAGFEVSGLP